MSGDLLTELQRHLRDVNDQFAGIVEHLVHIAPPAPVDGDAVVRGPDEDPSLASPAELQAKAQELSRSLVTRFRDINVLIEKLPDLREPPEVQDARIAGLLAEHHALRKELGAVMAEAERKLDEVHECYGALSQHTLIQHGRGA